MPKSSKSTELPRKASGSLEERLDTVGDVDALLDRLTFAEAGVTQAAIDQPKFYMDAAEYRVAWMRHRAKAEKAADSYKAEFKEALRAKLEKKNPQSRVTDVALDTAVRNDPEYKKLKARLRRAEEHEEFAKLLLDGFRFRMTAIKIVADLTGAEQAFSKAASRQSSGSPETMENLKKGLSKKYSGSVSK